MISTLVRGLALDLVDRFLHQTAHVVLGEVHRFGRLRAGEKSSTVVSSSAWRLSGVMRAKLACAAALVRLA